MNYPHFKFVSRLDATKYSKDYVRDYVNCRINDEWRMSGKDFFSLVYIDCPNIYFTCDDIYGVILILEKYMGHMWMVDKGLMKRAK